MQWVGGDPRHSTHRAMVVLDKPFLETVLVKDVPAGNVSDHIALLKFAKADRAGVLGNLAVEIENGIGNIVTGNNIVIRNNIVVGILGTTFH